MLITHDFVMLNYPKTGTTFTRAVLKQLYGDAIEEILGRNPMNPHSVPDSPHLAVSQIPARYADLPIVSIHRNVFDRYVSLWQFKWYTHDHPSVQEAARALYPSFPDLSLEQYLGMANRVQKARLLASLGFEPTDRIGFQSVQFIVFYARDPKTCLRDAIANPDLDLRRYVPEIHFLRQSMLRQDLTAFLASTPVGPAATDVIRTFPELNVTRTGEDAGWRHFWSDALMAEYTAKEAPVLNFTRQLGLDD
ncbi:MAG: hypothetical protein R3E94_02175 [Burkholderiaceae bacterium]